MKRDAQLAQLLDRDERGDDVLADTVIDQNLPDGLSGYLGFTALRLVKIQHLLDGAWKFKVSRGYTLFQTGPDTGNHSLICFSFRVTILDGGSGLGLGCSPDNWICFDFDFEATGHVTNVKMCGRQGATQGVLSWIMHFK